MGRLVKSRRHAAVYATLACWLAASLLCFTWGRELQGWIELLNGATWPSDHPALANGWRWVIFSVIIGLRTTLNLGASVALFGAAVWFLFGGRQKLVNLSIGRLIRHREAALIGKIAAFLNDRLPKGQITPSLMAELKLEVREFMDKNWRTPHD